MKARHSLSILQRSVLCTTLGLLFVSSGATAQESIVTYRDPGFFGPIPEIRVYERLDPTNLSSTTGTNFLTIATGSVQGDQLTLGDVNGDGLDDATLIRSTIVDPNSGYNGNFSGTFTSLTDPGPVLPVSYGGDPSAGNNSFSPTSDTISLRRDFNGNGIADTIVARDLRFPDYSGQDLYQWFALDTTAPLDSGDLSINGNLIQGNSWGEPSVDVPLVGDFNNDGIADRFIHRANGTAREGFIDLSTGPKTFGPGNFDNQVFLFNDDDEYAIADLNGDGFDDIAAIRNNLLQPSQEDSYTIFGLINDGNLGFANTVDWVWTIGEPSTGETIHFGNFQTFSSTPLQGDFNDDGSVDLADYTLWRNNVGNPESSLPDGTTSGNGTVGPEDYDLWKSNFGAPALSAQTSGVATVPEPSSWLLISAIVAASALLRRKINA